MVEPAPSRTLLERYGAIETAYCEEHWSTVIQDGQRLLHSLASAEEPVPEGLRERLELLMAHAYLYGFGDRDSAEDLYQAVLHSGAETSLRQIAEQGLQHCNRPAAMAAAQPAVEGAEQRLSPASEAAAAVDSRDPSQAAFWQDTPQTVASPVAPEVVSEVAPEATAAWEVPAAATAAARQTAVSPEAAASSEPTVFLETAVSPERAVPLERAVSPEREAPAQASAGSSMAAGPQDAMTPQGEADAAALAWLTEPAPPSSNPTSAAANPVMPWLEEGDPAAAAGLSVAGAAALFDPAGNDGAGRSPLDAAAGSSSTGQAPVGTAAANALAAITSEDPLAAGVAAPLGESALTGPDSSVTPEARSGMDASQGPRHPADGWLPSGLAEPEPAAPLALSSRTPAAGGAEARPGPGPEEEAILIPEVVEEPELLDLRVSDPDLMVELQQRLQERLAAIRSGKGRQPRDDSEPAEPGRSALVLEKGPVAPLADPEPGAFEAEAETASDPAVAAAGRDAAPSDPAGADDEVGGDGPGGSLEDGATAATDGDATAALDDTAIANDSGSGISFLGYGRKRARTPGPFAAPPVPIAEEEAEMLMGLLKVEMG